MWLIKNLPSAIPLLPILDQRLNPCVTNTMQIPTYIDCYNFPVASRLQDSFTFKNESYSS